MLADSSFCGGETRNCIMAGWRRAVELAMSEEEIATLTTLSRSRTELASRVSRAQMRWRIGKSFVLRGGPKIWGSSSDGAALCRARTGRWRPSMIVRDRARNQRSRLRPKPSWCRWRVTRSKTIAIRMSCGRRGSWRAMHVEEQATGCGRRIVLLVPAAPSLCRIRPGHLAQGSRAWPRFNERAARKAATISAAEVVKGVDRRARG